jgi:hypothetical protein
MSQYTDIDAMNSLGLVGQLTGNTAWRANQRAIYVPFKLPFQYRLAKFYWGNGTSISATVDMGIYDYLGSQIVHTGATPQTSGPASVLQGVVSSPDVLLDAGRYYMGILLSATQGSLCMWNTTVSIATAILRLREFNVMQENVGASTLPATMNPTTVTNPDIPAMCIVDDATRVF